MYIGFFLYLVILLFGSAISLGIQMKETGAALWVAGQTLSFL